MRLFLSLHFPLQNPYPSLCVCADSLSKASLVAQMVTSPPAVRETQVQSLGQEEPLEEEMATPSSILAWRAPRTEEPGGPQPVGSQSIGHERLTLLL